MTDEQHAALESLRDETEPAHGWDRFIPWLIALGVTLVVAAITGYGFLAIKVNTSARQAAAAAQSASKAAANTNTLLLNGKTASAISAKKGAVAAKEGEQIVAGIRAQLDELLARSAINRGLICSIAATVHVTSPVIRADCP
jgi:hypothetical protein